VATYYGLDFATMPANLIALWTAFAADMPNVVNIKVKQTGDEIEDTTGTLIGAWDNATPEVTIGGSGGDPYAAPIGGMVTWTTGSILDGRRVKGRSFVVPMSADAYVASGEINDVHLTVMQDAANAFVASEDTSLVIWHRPRAARPGPVPPARAARLGGHALVTGSSVEGKVAVLKSRRD
jgi:predicted aconitase with swiveling domain